MGILLRIVQLNGTKAAAAAAWVGGWLAGWIDTQQSRIPIVPIKREEFA